MQLSRLPDALKSWFSVVACLASLIGLAACEDQEAAAPPPEPPGVVVATATRIDVPIVMQFSGTIKPAREIEVIPRISGYIFARYFTEGTFVKAGDPLYLIDPRPFEERLNNLEAEQKSNRVALRFEEVEVDRYTRLAKTGAVSQEEADLAVTKRDQTLAAIEATEAKIDRTKLDLEYTRINAPFDGRIQATQIYEGNLVEAQQDVLTELIQMDPIQVVYSVNRAETFQMQTLVDQGTGFKIDDIVVRVTKPNGEMYSEPGRIDFISFKINPTTDTIVSRAILPNKRVGGEEGFTLIPGQYTKVFLTVGVEPDALTVPQAAVMETQAGWFVYVVGDDRTAELRKVSPGRKHENLWVIDNGLDAGERVIVEGVQKVKHGVEVRIEETESAPEPASG